MRGLKKHTQRYKLELYIRIRIQKALTLRDNIS